MRGNVSPQPSYSRRFKCCSLPGYAIFISCFAELFADVSKKCEDVETCMGENEQILTSIQLLKKLDIGTLVLSVKSDRGPNCLLQAWISVELILQPGRPTRALAEQLYLLQRLKGYSDVRLFSELMRASLLSLQNVIQTSHESLWGAFTFLKVKRILLYRILQNVADLENFYKNRLTR